MADVLPFISDLQAQIDNIQSNNTNTTDSAVIGRVFKFDFDNKRFAIEDGKPVELTTNKEKVEQWIHLILMTYKDAYKVYENTDFYCNIKDYIGKKMIGYTGFYKASLENEIKTAILKNKLVDQVYDFAITKVSERKWKASYTIVLKDGDLVASEEEV